MFTIVKIHQLRIRIFYFFKRLLPICLQPVVAEGCGSCPEMKEEVHTWLRLVCESSAIEQSTDLRYSAAKVIIINYQLLTDLNAMLGTYLFYSHAKYVCTVFLHLSSCAGDRLGKNSVEGLLAIFLIAAISLNACRLRAWTQSFVFVKPCLIVSFSSCTPRNDDSEKWSHAWKYNQYTVCESKITFTFVGVGGGGSEDKQVMSAGLPLPNYFRKGGICAYLGSVWLNVRIP